MLQLQQCLHESVNGHAPKQHIPGNVPLRHAAHVVCAESNVIMSSQHAPRVRAWELNAPTRRATLQRMSTRTPRSHEAFDWSPLANPIYSFDPASLAILQRLEILEGLLRTKVPGPIEPGHSTSEPSPLSALKHLGSPSLERSADLVPCYINIEAVLSWPVFEGQGFADRLDLKSLLQVDNVFRDPSPMSIGEDFESRVAGQLLQQFLDNVHIFNPVLEEAKVKDYMRNARFNGLGWDAQSCLLVNEPPQNIA